jgi:prepilin signal peptidase PulO-like enzyme (type II secretory pathway)
MIAIGGVFLFMILSSLSLTNFKTTLFSVLVLGLLFQFMDSNNHFGVEYCFMGAFVAWLVMFLIPFVFTLEIASNDAQYDILNLQKVEKVQFFEDTKTVAYVASPSGKVSSETLLEDDFYKQKSNYLDNGNCYIVKKHKYYEDLIDENLTVFECW